MTGPGHTPLTVTHPRNDSAQPQMTVRSFLGSGTSAAAVGQQSEVASCLTANTRPPVHKTKMADSYGKSAVSCGNDSRPAPASIAAFPPPGRVADSAPQSDMSVDKTQKSSGDLSQKAGRGVHPGAAGFLAASRLMPARGDNASSGQIGQLTGGHDANGSLIRPSRNLGSSANGGQVNRAACAHPADSADSFKSSQSAPDQDKELIDLTSPLAPLSQQYDTPFQRKPAKDSSKAGGQEPLHHEGAASSRFADQGMSSAGAHGSADSKGKPAGRSGDSQRSSGKENGARHSYNRHVPATRSDVLCRDATSSKLIEEKQQVGHRMHCFYIKVLSGYCNSIQ